MPGIVSCPTEYRCEIRTIDVQHKPENRVCQRTDACETDFASSIAFGDDGIDDTATPWL